MAKMGPAPRMFLQPRTKDKRVVTEALGHFDGFQVSATVPASTLTYVRDIGKPFFIDPMAYMFVLPPDAIIDPKTRKVRTGVSALATRYGSIFTRSVGKRPLSVKELLDQEEEIEEITRNALDYERKKLEAGDINLFNPYLDKYAQLALDEDEVPHMPTAITPWTLIPPYFHFSDVQDGWYKASLRCARAAAQFKRDAELVFPTIFMSRDLLDHAEAIDAIIADYDDSDYDGYFIWINDFSEEAASALRLANLMRLVQGLRATGRPVFKFHGGFFSILLQGLGLEGFSCSLSGRTDRDIFAYRWAAPKTPILPKFYVPGLHRVYPLDEAAQLMKMFPFLRCRCAACEQSYGGNLDIFHDRMKETGRCERHFLNVRRQELRAAQIGTAHMVAQLTDTIAQFTTGNAPGARHLVKWRDLIAAPRLIPADATALPDSQAPALATLTGQ